MKHLSQNKKRIIISIVVAFSLLISALFTYGPHKLWNRFISLTDPNAHSIGTVQSSEAAKQKLSVHFIDVGQGDSTLIRFEDKNILIDCAKKSNADAVYTYLDLLGINHLDLVIATHPDADHIGGFAELLYRLKPDLYLLPQLPDSIERTQTELNLINTLKTLKVKTEYAVNNKTYDFGDMKLTTFITQQEHDDKNDYSVISKVCYKKTSFLFTGDAGKNIENELMKHGFDLSADVLKAGHHGSSKSSSERFVKYVNPSYCVFSCGAGNDYGHPHAEVLAIMQKLHIKCFRTDADGSIVIGSDGNKIFSAAEK